MSSRPDAHHPPPYDGANAPLISDSEKSPRSPRDDVGDSLISNPEQSTRTPILFDSREQFWSNMVSISWRCSTSALSLALLILGLRIFSQMGELSKIQQRGFNAITILLSALTSLGLGSMLGYLGSMLRWRLLARKKYKMQDIELLLAMKSPTGSAKLLVEHVRGRRVSLTTSIVMLYLFVNITGRFSVAIFGLTYNLKDEPVTIPPTLITNWNSTVLDSAGSEEGDKGILSYLELVRGGLATFAEGPFVRFNASERQYTDSMILEALKVSNLTSPQIQDGINFEYCIREIVGVSKALIPSDHIVNSIATCTMFRINNYKYWKDYDNDNKTSKDWTDKSNRETVAEVLRVLDDKGAWPQEDDEYVTWAAPRLVGQPKKSVTYVVYSETVWECSSTLHESQGTKPHPKPLFNPASLFLLPMVPSGDACGASESAGHLDNSCGDPLVGGTATIVYRSFAEPQSRTNPSVGVQKLNFYGNGTRGSADQKKYYNLYVAGLIARLPIVAIAYGNAIFPRMYKDPNPHWTTHVYTTLEVKWDRVGIAAVIIVISQILVITAVVQYCRNVYVREDSDLTTAELLKTVLNMIDNGNAMTAKELGDALDDVLEDPISYGTIPGSQGGQPRMALGYKVDYNFPGFPPLRKRSIFRR